jgi:hypothetical protein
MNVKFTGKIIAAGQVQTGTSQNGTQWSSCEYTIEELNEQYPSRAVIQVYGSDKLQQFNIQLGEIITAHIGLKARQSKEGRWFNQLDCWKVDRPSTQPQGQVSQNPQQQGGYYAPPQQQFPPQVNASGQATQQGVLYSGRQQGNIPFPQR